MCLPQSFLQHGNIKIPRKKHVRHFLAMNNCDTFKFKILQSSGGDCRSLILPELSLSYKWTASAVAGRNAKTPIYWLRKNYR